MLEAAKFMDEGECRTLISAARDISGRTPLEICDALDRAEKLDPTALEGGIYASLGALYSKVPGGFMGFGDDEIATEYFEKALAVDADTIDNNYFYGEFLLVQGDYARARSLLEHALAAPPVAERPVFDAGRRAEIRDLLAVARRKTS